MSEVGDLVGSPERAHRNGQRDPGGLVRFLLLAFVLSWIVWLPLWWWDPPDAIGEILLILGTFGPSTAAVLVLASESGWRRLGAKLRPLWQWRLPTSWWLLVLVAPPAVILAAIGLAGLFGVPPGEWQDPGQLYLIVPVFVYIAVLGGPLGEELGWRGFAFPRLQRRFTPTVGAVLLGLIWGLWHIPLFNIEGTVQQDIPPLAFLAQVTATSVIFGWLWNRTRSLPAVIALHASVNTSVGLLPVLPDQAGSAAVLWSAVSLAAAGAIALIALTGGRLGSRR